METLYAPYRGDEPATLSVNGHRIVVLSPDPAAIEESLTILGGETVGAVQEAGSTDDVIARLSADTHAYVVVTPREVSVPQMLSSLSESLPWLQ